MKVDIMVWVKFTYYVLSRILQFNSRTQVMGW